MTLLRRFITTAAALRSTFSLHRVSLSSISPAADSLFQISLDVSASPSLISSYNRPGQYLQLCLPHINRSTLLAIASPPSLADSHGVFEFLVKSVSGSTAEMLCELKEGDVVELSHAIGNGFEIEEIRTCQTVLIFATGSGISPIRSLIETGFNADEKPDVRLYFGAKNLNRMAYQDRFKVWESSGVRIVPVLSQPHDSWTGERGFVQDAFSRAKKIYNPHSTGAVLCGHRQMAEVCYRCYQYVLLFRVWLIYC
ncbi:hypothetical protein AgCh_002290 [Apium graveolens]